MSSPGSNTRNRAANSAAPGVGVSNSVLKS